jgi:hypothetical protein
MQVVANPTNEGIHNKKITFFIAFLTAFYCFPNLDEKTIYLADHLLKERKGYEYAEKISMEYF